MSIRNRNILAIVLILTSFACLVPGLYLSILTIDIAPTLPFFGKMALHRETRSILGTIGNLYETGNILVANLILLFSVVIPALKGLLLLGVLATRYSRGRLMVFQVVRSIGKWSMADVFVVGIFIAYLSTGAAKGIAAWLHSGFYFFLAYCLVSVLAVQIMKVEEI